MSISLEVWSILRSQVPQRQCFARTDTPMSVLQKIQADASPQTRSPKQDNLLSYLKLCPSLRKSAIGQPLLVTCP